MPPPKKEWASEEERQEHQRALGRARNSRWRAKRAKVAPEEVAAEGSGSAEAMPAAVLQSGPAAAAHRQHHQQQQQQCDGGVASPPVAIPGQGESSVNSAS
jgi:hypothetical protein